MNSDVRRRLKAVADDLQGPLGQIPLDRALRRHTDLFKELRRDGCTWVQLARALAAVGVRRADGGMVSADHLRGTVSRQIKERLRAPSEPIPESQPVRSRKTVPKPGARSKAAASGAASSPAPTLSSPKRPETEKSTRMPAAGASRSIHEKLARVAKMRGV
jgi:hypothetical protein